MNDYRHIEHQTRGPQTQEQLDNFNRMIAKKERQGGIVKGFHGTAASLARIITEEGFKDKHDAKEDGYGIYFWDEEVANNAHSHGQDKARELEEIEYAVVEAVLHNPRPDFLMGRPQWLVNGHNVTVVNVTYHKLEDDK